MVWKMITNRIKHFLEKWLTVKREQPADGIDCMMIENYLKQLIPEINLRLLLEYENISFNSNILWIESVTVTAYEINKKRKKVKKLWQ